MLGNVRRAALEYMDDGFEFPRDRDPEPFMRETFVGEYVHNVTDYVMLLRESYGDTFLVLHTTVLKNPRRCSLNFHGSA